ncbi:MAG: SPOR domain-containing protein [Pseudomonadota bacterium]|nr:SPOR domain-containing protein [Pseudomonadota bacterium]
MLIRAVIVFLLALNLGVAAWWLLRPSPPPAAVDGGGQQTGGLRLVGEPVTEVAAVGDNAVDASPASARIAVPAQCFALGPFADPEAAARAQAALAPVTSAIEARRVYRNPPRGWRVYLPPFGSLEQVQAAAQRVAAAGFSDYFVVREGEEANSLALGRYGSRATAEARALTLVEAGFAAQAGPIQSGPYVVWLDVEASAELEAAQAQQMAQASDLEAMNCAMAVGEDASAVSPRPQRQSRPASPDATSPRG